MKFIELKTTQGESMTVNVDHIMKITPGASWTNVYLNERDEYGELVSYMVKFNYSQLSDILVNH